MIDATLIVGTGQWQCVYRTFLGAKFREIPELPDVFVWGREDYSYVYVNARIDNVFAPHREKVIEDFVNSASISGCEFIFFSHCPYTVDMFEPERVIVTNTLRHVRLTDVEGYARYTSMLTPGEFFGSEMWSIVEEDRPDFCSSDRAQREREADMNRDEHQAATMAMIPAASEYFEVVNKCREGREQEAIDVFAAKMKAATEVAVAVIKERMHVGQAVVKFSLPIDLNVGEGLVRLLINKGYFARYFCDDNTSKVEEIEIRVPIAKDTQK